MVRKDGLSLFSLRMALKIYMVSAILYISMFSGFTSFSLLVPTFYYNEKIILFYLRYIVKHMNDLISQKFNWFFT